MMLMMLMMLLLLMMMMMMNTDDDHDGDDDDNDDGDARAQGIYPPLLVATANRLSGQGAPVRFLVGAVSGSSADLAPRCWLAVCACARMRVCGFCALFTRANTRMSSHTVQ